MEIKGAERFQTINESKKTSEKAQSLGTSFFDIMRNHINIGEVNTAAPEGTEDLSVNGLDLYQLSGVEAIGARSRIHYTNAGDVSDFLELIQNKQFLLKDASFDDLSDTEDAVKQMSSTDAQSLGEKYDINNLTQDEQYALFRELVVSGVVSKPDAQKLQLSVSPDEDDLMGYIKDEPAFRDVLAIPETDVQSRLEAMIQNERFAVDHVRERYGKKCDAVSQLADSHIRTQNVLTQIQSG